MADDVTSVEIPAGTDNGEGVKIETEHRAEDAPWGYKADGTPYKRDPSAYRAREARKSGGARAPRAKTKSKAPGYRDSVLGIFQVISLPIAAAATKDLRFAADLVVMEQSAEPVADAVEALALQNKRVAAALDKMAEVGPYGLLIGALAPMILQIGANHGAPWTGLAGTVPPEDLLGVENSDLNGQEAA